MKLTRDGGCDLRLRRKHGRLYLTGQANVTSPAGSFSYTLGGTVAGSPLPKKLLLPNTSYITNTYDNVARLTGTWLKNSTNGTLNSHAYTYNAGHQRTQQVFSAGSTYDYTYDGIGQLTVADSATGSEDRGYTYDAAWNLNWRTNGGTGQSFSVNSRNELTSGLSGAAYFYHDDNGNLTHSNNVSGNPTLTCSYDDENQLVEMLYSDGIGEESFLESAGSGWRTVFTYDGRGRLRLRQDYEWSGSAWSLTLEHRYVYDGMRVIQTRQGNNTPYVSYTRGNDLSGSLEGAGGIGGLLGRSHLYSGGNWYTHNFYHADENGNITYLVNSSQGMAASYRYDPYGNTISSSGTLAFANVYRFSSKEIHWNSGFYYYGYRWYAPNLQRWPNSDPLGDLGSPVILGADVLPAFADLNLYQFVRNEPTGLIDLWGLVWVAIGQDHTKNASTIVCDGQGGIRPKLCPAHQNMPCGLTDCVIAHENSHKDDVLAERPNICKGKKDNTRIGQTFNPTLWKSEIKAANAAIACAKALKAKASPDCQQPIDNFVKGEEAYRDGFQDKLDGWRRTH